MKNVKRIAILLTGVLVSIGIVVMACVPLSESVVIILVGLVWALFVFWALEVKN